MNRNGLVFVPREPPKRVILYPTQDSSNQQHQPNGPYTRAKTTLVTNNYHETIEQSNHNVRLSRQQAFSSPPHHSIKINEKSDHDKPVQNSSGQSTVSSVGQKLQIPYNANPFFRPKVVFNQQPTTAITTLQSVSRDSSIVNSNANIQTLIPSTTTITANKERQSTYPKAQSPLLSGGRIQEPEPTATTSTVQDDNRRWAHAVPATSIARRTASDEHTNGTLRVSETNITNLTNNDALKQKGTSATDIVISLMDTWRAPINPGNTSAINIFPRPNGIKDDSAIPGQPSTAGGQLPNTPPFPTSGNSTASNNNQNWKKALLANFQKNSRNIPAAKLFNSKQTTVPPQPSNTANNDGIANQQKGERSIFNGISNERTFQANETTRSIIRKSSENLRPTKQDENNANNNNNNIERSTSLQIQGSGYSNQTAAAPNKTEETAKSIETSNLENMSHAPLSVPTSLITAKPPASVEQQRAIITRVMIRRDFVKSTESKPPMPTASNIRSVIPARSAKPGGLPTNNIVQVAIITENNTGMNTNLNGSRIYSAQLQSQLLQQQQLQRQQIQLQLQQQLQPQRQQLLPPSSQQQQQQQQTIPLSQKSLLSFTAPNPIIKESLKIETNQQQSHGIANDGAPTISVVKMQQSSTNNNPAFRSNSVSAANAELRRKKEEINNKIKKRAISASAASNDGYVNNSQVFIQ
ncbi:unnamed protein product [Rotaria magnacalcarata]|uniref:Uncharacterized protein n=3 Tax=Rotaria magnacalcarata TaxID=392030 RepID=A0A816M4G4_9BILA|nr:unnamed protein product [Rotaria magnacalcarata]CAF3784964.1 unnamed protein product [Rotaria magnacalcarata]